jgi:calmodulin
MAAHPLIGEWREAFQLFDKSGNGNLDMEESAKVMRSLGLKPSQADMQQVFGTFDTDKKGRLNFDQFCAAMNKLSEVKEDDQEEIRQAFSVFDKDMNGMISTNELRFVLMEMGEKMTEEEVNMVLSEADPNNTGHINYQPWVTMMLNK